MAAANPNAYITNISVLDFLETQMVGGGVAVRNIKRYHLRPQGWQLSSIEPFLENTIIKEGTIHYNEKTANWDRMGPNGWAQNTWTEAKRKDFFMHLAPPKPENGPKLTFDFPGEEIDYKLMGNSDYCMQLISKLSGAGRNGEYLHKMSEISHLYLCYKPHGYEANDD